MDELSRLTQGQGTVLILVIALIALGALILWIAWILLPFAVFGLKKRLDELIEKHESVVKKYDKIIDSQFEIITRLEWLIYAINKDIYKEFQDRLKDDKKGMMENDGICINK